MCHKRGLAEEQSLSTVNFNAKTLKSGKEKVEWVAKALSKVTVYMCLTAVRWG